jgi:ketosteroid isomerase-like protein
MNTSRYQVSDALMQRAAADFVDAVNGRDAEALIVLLHPDVEFRPSVLAGTRSVYRGHEGVRRYFAQLRATDRDQRVRLSEVRRIGDARFVVLAEVMLDGEAVSPAAVIMGVQDDKAIEVTAYLSDEQTLVSVGLIPGPD